MLLERKEVGWLLTEAEVFSIARAMLGLVVSMKRAVLFSVLVCLSSCGIIPDHQTPVPDLNSPDHWTGTTAFSVQDPLPWLLEIQDPALEALVKEALLHNFDLQAASARVEIARATARVNGADRFPQVSAGADAMRSQRNSTQGFTLTNPRNNNFGVDFSLNWELDVWGKLKNRAQAAELGFAASEMDFKYARLSLAARVASAWFRVIGANQQLGLAEKKVQAFIQTQKIIYDGFVDGIFNPLDLRLARANVSVAQSQRDGRRMGLDNALRSLEILLGRYPQASLAAAASLPELKPHTAVSLPSTLLRRRPDIIAAEQRLLAADQQFNAAWKNLLPSFSFAASGGTNAGRLSDILDYNQLVWNILGNLTQPLFQGGRLIAQKEQANAQALEAASNYATVILTAYFEVETGLYSEQLLETQEKSFQIASHESVEAERLALEEYSSGLVDMMTLLESQRRSYDARSALLEVSTQRLLNRVNLYLALGVDIEIENDPSPAMDQGWFVSSSVN